MEATDRVPSDPNEVMIYTRIDHMSDNWEGILQTKDFLRIFFHGYLFLRSG